MAEKRNIFLVGPMGAGKSTIGRHLADELHLDFLIRIRKLSAARVQTLLGSSTLKVKTVSVNAKKTSLTI